MLDEIEVLSNWAMIILRLVEMVYFRYIQYLSTDIEIMYVPQFGIICCYSELVRERQHYFSFRNYFEILNF